MLVIFCFAIFLILEWFVACSYKEPFFFYIYPKKPGYVRLKSGEGNQNRSAGALWLHPIEMDS